MQPVDSGKGYSYIGNDDFRGYLAANSPGQLPYSGNDGNIDTAAIAKQMAGASQGAIDNTTNYAKSAVGNLYANWSAANAKGKTTGPGGTTTPTTGGYQPPDYAALQNAYDGQFNNAVGNLNNQQQLAKSISQSGQNQVNQSYGVQLGGIQQQLAQGNAGLDLAQNKLDTYKSNGIRDLGSEMRQAIQSYGNQLGVAGAGDSSAVGMANYGLSQQANRATNDLNTSADQQQTGLNQSRTNLAQGFDQNKKMLDDWKGQQIQNIVNNYATQLQQIQSQMGSAQSQRAIDLAYIGKGQAANQALSQLQSLEDSYGSNLNQLQSSYSSIQAPTAEVHGYDQQFNVNPLTSEQIGASSLANNAVSSDPTYTPIRLRSDATA